jgi:hypothetical protein
VQRYRRVVKGRGALFWLVLAASLATNGYLLHARARYGGQPPTPAPPTEAPVHRARPVVPAPTGPAAAIPQEIAKLDRAALENRLRKAEAKVDALRPLYEKFDLAAGGGENEPRVRAVIDRVFGVEGSGERPYDLECRGDICRFQTDRPPGEWQDAFQFDMAGLARDMSFSSDAVYFHVDDASRAAGKRYVIDIASALWMSPRLAACKHGQTAIGTVTVTLRLVARHVEVDASGPLADTPVGSCVRKLVEDLVDETPLPDAVVDLPFNTLPVAVP